MVHTNIHLINPDYFSPDSGRIVTLITVRIFNDGKTSKKMALPSKNRILFTFNKENHDAIILALLQLEFHSTVQLLCSECKMLFDLFTSYQRLSSILLEVTWSRRRRNVRNITVFKMIDLVTETCAACPCQFYQTAPKLFHIRLPIHLWFTLSLLFTNDFKAAISANHHGSNWS